MTYLRRYVSFKDYYQMVEKVAKEMEFETKNPEVLSWAAEWEWTSGPLREIGFLEFKDS